MEKLLSNTTRSRASRFDRKDGCRHFSDVRARLRETVNAILTGSIAVRSVSTRRLLGVETEVACIGLRGTFTQCERDKLVASRPGVWDSELGAIQIETKTQPIDLLPKGGLCQLRTEMVSEDARLTSELGKVDAVQMRLGSNPLATLVAFLISGVFLVQSVKREIAQREHIEKLAKELAETNERQETLMHFVGHEVKGFLTKDAGAFAAISQGDFGVPPDGMKPFVDRALVESRQGSVSVENILKASNLKNGTVTYTKNPFDLKELAAAAVEKARPAAEQKGLSLTFSADETSYQMTGDKTQINDHVLRNLIENSINYTPSGSVAVSLKKENDKFIFVVKDTGIGITEEDKKRLFTEGGHGKDSQTMNVHSTGYGLFIAKQITEAHGGTIRAESEGAGKGATFIVEFPA